MVLGTGDELTGQTSRIDVANACVESIKNSNSVNKAFEIVNQGARASELDWNQLFEQL